MYGEFSQFFETLWWTDENINSLNMIIIFLKQFYFIFFTWTDGELNGRPALAYSPAVVSILMVRILNSGNGMGQKLLPSLF